jgi:hypothetical protein
LATIAAIGRSLWVSAACFRNSNAAWALEFLAIAGVKALRLRANGIATSVPARKRLRVNELRFIPMTFRNQKEDSRPQADLVLGIGVRHEKVALIAR